jgi:hypothetical protein
MYGSIVKMQSTLQFIAGQLKKPKERFETILEPLQALLQIGLLTFYPIGSKLAIHNNILTVQAPGYTQHMRRWYNNDKKEDVFYLYNVFSRFNKFYKTILAGAGGGTGAGAGAGAGDGETFSSSSVENIALFALLHELAKSGINNLIRTYNQTDKIHILHTLQMYKGMLDNPELTRRIAVNRPDDAIADDDENCHLPSRVKSPSSSPPLRPMTAMTALGGSASNVPIDSLVDTNIDLIFVKITDLYTQEDYTIIYKTLLKIQSDPLYYLNYIDGLNKILEPVNIRIKKWIDDNIVF